MTFDSDAIYTAVNDKGQYFEIVKDNNVGFYIYIYENGNTKCTYDYLQDTLEIAMRSMREDFGVPESAWQKVG